MKKGLNVNERGEEQHGVLGLFAFCSVMTWMCFVQNFYRCKVCATDEHNVKGAKFYNANTFESRIYIPIASWLCEEN